jgi:hypothetical protein
MPRCMLSADIWHDFEAFPFNTLSGIRKYPPKLFILVEFVKLNGRISRAKLIRPSNRLKNKRHESLNPQKRCLTLNWSHNAER